MLETRYNHCIESTTHKGNEMNRNQLIATIINSGKIENQDAAMHADAIIAGDYTLVELFANATSFYAFDGYKHDDELQMEM